MCQLAKIKVGNLGVDNVIPLVAEALSMDDYDNKVSNHWQKQYKRQAAILSLL